MLAARTGESLVDPRLAPLEDAPDDPRWTTAASDQLEELVGEWVFPPEQLELERRTTVTVRAEDGHLVAHLPVAGTFRLDLQPDGTLWREDAQDPFFVIRDDRGAVVGLAGGQQIAEAIVVALVAGETDRARALLDQSAGPDMAVVESLKQAMKPGKKVDLTRDYYHVILRRTAGR